MPRNSEVTMLCKEMRWKRRWAEGCSEQQQAHSFLPILPLQGLPDSEFSKLGLQCPGEDPPHLTHLLGGVAASLWRGGFRVKALRSCLLSFLPSPR